jgi:hypothetical protein
MWYEASATKIKTSALMGKRARLVLERGRNVTAMPIIAAGKASLDAASNGANPIASAPPGVNKNAMAVVIAKVDRKPKKLETKKNIE